MSVSAREDIPVCAVSSSSARSRIPTFVAPGSWVAMTSYPCSRSQIASSRAWVVLPAPSPPSKAISSPRWVMTGAWPLGWPGTGANGSPRTAAARSSRSGTPRRSSIWR